MYVCTYHTQFYRQFNYELFSLFLYIKRMWILQTLKNKSDLFILFNNNKNICRWSTQTSEVGIFCIISYMVWFFAFGEWTLIKLKGNLKKENCINILESNVPECIEVVVDPEEITIRSDYIPLFFFVHIFLLSYEFVFVIFYKSRYFCLIFILFIYLLITIQLKIIF